MKSAEELAADVLAANETRRLRHEKAQRRFLLKKNARDAPPDKDAASGSAAASKLTPLEQQVVAVKNANPGLVLLVEVRSRTVWSRT